MICIIHGGINPWTSGRQRTDYNRYSHFLLEVGSIFTWLLQNLSRYYLRVMQNLRPPSNLIWETHPSQYRGLCTTLHIVYAQHSHINLYLFGSLEHAGMLYHIHSNILIWLFVVWLRCMPHLMSLFTPSIARCQGSHQTLFPWHVYAIPYMNLCWEYPTNITMRY